MHRYFADNRLNWNDRVGIHSKDETGSYQVKAFLNGADNLHAIEDREIGEVRGKRIAHLQCHFGIDTLCLARRGARCVGLDFSPVAIKAARELQQKTGLDAQFVEGDVYDARTLLQGDFDLVYVTWGAINWLPDMPRWASVVGSLLRPGGSVYLLEGHPFLMTIDENQSRPQIGFDWRTPEDTPMTSNVDTTYTGDATKLTHTTTHEWIHPFSRILNALIGAGLRLDFLNEHEELAWQFAPYMLPWEGKRRMWILPPHLPRMALAFSLSATKI